MKIDIYYIMCYYTAIVNFMRTIGGVLDLYKSEDSRRAVRLLIPHKLFMIV